MTNILTNLAYHKREIKVFGGNQLRPNIHINDMINAYIHMIEAPKKIISGQKFNVGYDNQYVNSVALLVIENEGSDVKIINVQSNDDRSYHISSKKIEKILGFKSKFTVEDAINDLKKAFQKNLLPNSFNDEKYFNIKRMQSIQLK